MDTTLNAIGLDEERLKVSMQFRKHGQHKSANEMGKLSIMIVNAFSEGIDQIPANDYALEEMVGYLSPGSVEWP